MNRLWFKRSLMSQLLKTQNTQSYSSQVLRLAHRTLFHGKRNLFFTAKISWLHQKLNIKFYISACKILNTGAENIAVSVRRQWWSRHWCCRHSQGILCHDFRGHFKLVPSYIHVHFTFGSGMAWKYPLRFINFYEDYLGGLINGKEIKG